MKRIPVLLFSLLTFSAQPVLSQTVPLSLTGNVQSEAQQALAGAAVTVIHVPSGKRYSAASNSAGSFVVPNLPAGGPYLMQIGEGGYRSQTLESIFLESGKTANFSVTLSRLGSAAKGRAGRTTATTSTPAERLAPESEVGGPVLFAANTAPAGLTTTGSGRRYQPVPQIISAPAVAPTPGPA
ncbi:carboxypeptidase-like regulatory domain-containing protein, partial [Hymenobacter agri]